MGGRDQGSVPGDATSLPPHSPSANYATCPHICCAAFPNHELCKNGSALLTSQFLERIVFSAQVDISTGFPVAVGYRRPGGEQHWLSWRDQRARNLAARNGEEGSHQGSERSSKSPKFQQSAFLKIVAYIGLCCRCLFHLN